MYATNCFLLVSILAGASVAAGASRGAAFTFDLIRRDAPSWTLRAENDAADATNWLGKISPRGLVVINPEKCQVRKPRGGRAIRVPEAPVSPYKGVHIMKLAIGTPPVDVYGVADTGSDLIWTQCEPCPNCFKQNYPLFEPGKSSTYRDVSCEDPKCSRFIRRPKCASPKKQCQYSYDYADGSLTEGFLSADKLSVESSSGAPVPLDMYFGCGHNNSGTFNERVTGIIGLGGGPQSFVSQLAAASDGKKMVSQCLIPSDAGESVAGRISFGGASEVAGPEVSSIDMIEPYTAELYGMSVGDSFVPYQSGLPGKMFFDSGTPATYVSDDFYNRLVAEVRKQRFINIKKVALEPIEDDPEIGTQLYRAVNNLVGPNMTFRFKGGSVKVTTVQTFVRLKPGVHCLTVCSAGEDSGGIRAIYGNFAQSNFAIGFNLDAMKISFKPTDCTKP